MGSSYAHAQTYSHVIQQHFMVLFIDINKDFPGEYLGCSSGRVESTGQLVLHSYSIAVGPSQNPLPMFLMLLDLLCFYDVMPTKQRQTRRIVCCTLKSTCLAVT